MKNNNFLLIVFTIILFGCGVPQKDFDKLQTENTQLKKDLEDCQFGAKKLYSQAIAYYDNNEYEKCKKELSVLDRKHAGSNEATKGKNLYKKVVAEQMQKQKAERKEREEREKIEKMERAERMKKEQQRLASATKKMRIKNDDISGVTWYYDKTSPRYTNYNAFHIYMGKTKTGTPWLRFVIQYTADDWLFIEKYIIKADGQTFIITEKEYGEIKSDHSGGKIWEWLDRYVERDDFDIIKAVANGKNTKIRFIGSKYHKDKTITTRQKQALKNVLDAYYALGGTMK